MSLAQEIPPARAGSPLARVVAFIKGLVSFDTSLSRRIILLAAPTVAAMVTQTVINEADHILVGWYLPEAESVPGQTALQGSLILLWFFGGALSALLSVGTQALVARRLGEGRDHDAGAVLSNGLAFALVAAPVMTLLAWTLAPASLGLMTKDPAVLRLGVPFLRWRYLQITGMVMTACYKSFFDGIGKTWVHLAAAVVMNVVNFLLAMALLTGKWGFPRMGVTGVGVASCISSYVGLLMMILWSLPAGMRERFRYYRRRILRMPLVEEIVKLSWPTAIATLATMSGFFFFLIIVSRIPVAAGESKSLYTTVTSNIINVLQIVFISGIGYATATATLVGQNMGAKKFAIAERYVYQAAKIGFLFFLLVPGFISFEFAHPILRFWCKSSVQVADVAAPILRVLGGFEPLVAVALVFTYALYGAGNSLFVMVVELILHFTCLVPLAWLLGITFGLGIWGVWIAMIAYLLLLSSIMAIKFSTGSWKLIQI